MKKINITWKRYCYAQDLKFVATLGAEAYQRGIMDASQCDIHFHAYIKEYRKEPKKLIGLMQSWRKGYFDALHYETSFQGS